MPAESIPKLAVEDWALMQARLAWCYEGSVRPENRRLRSERKHLCAWHVLAGAAVVRGGKKQWRAGPGQWLLAGPDGFEQEFSPEARIVSVNFRLEWASGESLVRSPLVFSGERYPELLKAGRVLARFIGREFPGTHLDLWRQGAELDEFFELQRLFSRWVQAYLRVVGAEGAAPVRARGVEPRVAATLRHLERHRWGEVFHEAGLAKELGISVSQLERLFSRRMGLTLRGFLKKRRVEAALAALADETAPVKSVAYELGFVSAAHFSTWLKKETGCSPRGHRAGRAKRA